MTTLQEAYDMIDRFLRNNLDDDNYAEYSEALDLLSSPAPALAQQGEPVAWIRETDITELTDSEPETDGWEPLYKAAPAPQAQPESITCDCGRTHKRTAYGWACNEPAQPVAAQGVGIYITPEQRKTLMTALDIAYQTCCDENIALINASRDMLQSTQPVAQPLTNGEIYTAYIAATNQTLRPQDERLALAFARAIEAAHGIGAEKEMGL